MHKNTWSVVGVCIHTHTHRVWWREGQGMLPWRASGLVRTGEYIATGRSHFFLTA